MARNRMKVKKPNEGGGNPPQREPVYVTNDAGKLTRFSLNLSNRYAALQGADEDVQTEVVKEKKIRIPLITVRQLDKKILCAAMKELGISQYRLKLTSMGINIFLNDTEHHQKVRDELKKGNHEFFSHDLPNDKLVKVVLRGLDRMKHPELMAYLEECGVKPADVRTITPKQSRYTDQANYVLSFVKDGFAMKDLQQIRAVNYNLSVLGIL